MSYIYNETQNQAKCVIKTSNQDWTNNASIGVKRVGYGLRTLIL